MLVGTVFRKAEGPSYSKTGNDTLKLLITFHTIYLYEQVFSTLVTEVKRENTESDL